MPCSRSTRAISSNIAGSALRGTETSSMSAVPSDSMAGCIARRIARSRSPSAGSCETVTFPPALRSTAAMASASATAAAPVRLDRELRGARRGRVQRQQRVHGRQGRGIHQLHDRGLHAGRGDGGGCLGRRTHVGEGRGDRADLAGHEPAQLQRRTDDDAERPFGADDERRQIEAGHALHRAVAEAQQPSVGEHEIDAEHRIAHHAVLRAEEAAGAGRDVAAHRRDGTARGIRRPPQSVRLRVRR